MHWIGQLRPTKTSLNVSWTRWLSMLRQCKYSTAQITCRICCVPSSRRCEISAAAKTDVTQLPSCRLFPFSSTRLAILTADKKLHLWTQRRKIDNWKHMALKCEVPNSIESKPSKKIKNSIFFMSAVQRVFALVMLRVPLVDLCYESWSWAKYC